MKKTKLTAGSNLLWEGSRMMLPEHKEAIIAQYDQELVKRKPQLDEQKLEEISIIIQESYQHNIAINLTVYDYEEDQYSGIVTYIDPQFKYLKLDCGQQYTKINCMSIIDASY